MSIRSVCVFCASSSQVHSDYFDAARRLGELLAQERRTLVYGGGNAGLMGALADASLSGQGRVVGVIPGFMTEVEWAHRALSDLRVVDGMHERVQIMMQESEGFVILPGGCGTFDEFFQALTWEETGLLPKPIVLVNIRGFFDPCLDLLARCIDEKFMNPQHGQMWQVVDDVDKVLPTLDASPPWDENARQFAAVK